MMRHGVTSVPGLRPWMAWVENERGEIVASAYYATEEAAKAAAPWLRLPRGAGGRRTPEKAGYKAGDRVVRSGYPGTVQGEYLPGMYVVRLAAGDVVVPGRELRPWTGRECRHLHRGATNGR